MKVPLTWLAEYVDLPSDVVELTDALTAIGHMQDKPPEKKAGDTVLDLEVRQNRSDCLSLVGLAREISAVTDSKLKPPSDLATRLPDLVKGSLITIGKGTQCYRFNALQLDNLHIGPSPTWMVKRLEAYGIKPINNLVDITNYVMVELGQPLHVFDAQKITGKLTVRQANNNEQLRVLGEKVIKLTSSDVVIADNKKILALGGIIGGTASAITDKTTSIILEAATYNQASIRRSSLRHSLRTEASLRHEKFLHPALTELALQRAAYLIQTLCQGTVVRHDDAYPKHIPQTTVSLSLPRLQMLAGVKISLAEAKRILKKLGLEVSQKNKDTLVVTIPYFRTDLTLEEDVIEEVLRIYGYDKVPDRLPPTPVPQDINSKSYELEESIRDILVGFGFSELITEPLTKETTPLLEPVVLENSLNADKTMLRTTLQNGLLAGLNYHQKFKKETIFLFEIGKVYYLKNSIPSEKKMLAGLMWGAGVSYLTLKGTIEALLYKLGISLESVLVILTSLEKGAVYFELELDQLLQQKTNAVHYTILTSVPQVINQDLSFTVPEKVAVGQVLEKIRSLSPLVYHADLGEYPHQLTDTTKNLFLKLQYRSPDKQVTSAEVEPIRQQIITLIQKEFGGNLR